MRRLTQSQTNPKKTKLKAIGIMDVTTKKQSPSADDQTVVNHSSNDQTVVAPNAPPTQDATVVSSNVSSNKDDLTRLTPSDNPTVFVPPRPITAADVEQATRVKLPKSSNQVSSDGLDQGFVIKERFVLEQELGRGGMGVVYKARDLRKEEMHDESPMVALKLLNNELQDRYEALVALQRETVKSQLLAHPNIVTVYDFDRDGDLVYMSMEYLDGKTLDQLLQSGYFTNLTRENVITLIEHIARGLAYAHKEGFAHADLKPGNIFLSHKGTVKVLDFGIAQAIRGADDHTPVYDAYYDSMALSAVTPNYASPEVLEDQPPTPADDMYALGCIAYALLTGEHPFVDEQGNKVTSLIARDQHQGIEKIPDVPARFMAAVSRCLAFERDQRFNNAGEFLDAIKPPAKLKRWVVVTLVGCVCAALISWWVLLQQSTITLTLSDIPDDMSELVTLIKSGDQLFEQGEVDQSHKLYAQAWEGSFDQAHISRKDQLQLKVIIDRRIDAIIRYVIEQSEATQKDEFSLLQLQIALEFLQRGNLGTMDSQIEQSLITLDEKLKAL